MTNPRDEMEIAASPSSDDSPAISSAILTLAQPLLEKHSASPKRVRSIVALAVAAWNKAMLPAAAQGEYEKANLDAAVPPGGHVETLGTAVEIMDMIEDRRKDFFPNLRAVITKYDLQISEERLNLDVQSASIATESEALQ